MDTSHDAAAQLANDLEQWKSPTLGKLPVTSPEMMSEHTWLHGNDMDSAPRQEEVPTRPVATPPPNKERAGTPIMSNSSHREERSEQPPVNVQSPWIARTSTAVVQTPRQPTTKGNHAEYRRYYEAVLHYVRGKQSLKERMQLEKKHQTLLLHGTTDDDAMEIDDLMIVPTAAMHKFGNEDSMLECDLLRSLSSVCWDRDNDDRPEGNLWALLYSLRTQGLGCLIWQDDQDSKRQHEKSLDAYLSDLARQVDATPAELIKQLYSDSSRPLILQRRQQILQWLHRCFQVQLPPRAARPRKTTFRTNTASLLTGGLPETDKDSEVLHNALALILAGRLSDAQTLARESGVAWRAAVWSGGKPQGLSEDNEEIGNKDRFLWKYMLWLQSEKMAANPAANVDESAIVALLSCHLDNALANQSLQTWEHGLWSAVNCLMGRIEDRLLQEHNTNRRQHMKYFPGSEHEGMERQVLHSSSRLAYKGEGDLIGILALSPFGGSQQQGIADEACSSVLVGKSGIMSFFGAAVSRVQEMTSANDVPDALELRFLTHMAIYFDSLSSSSCPIDLEQMVEWKNQLLSIYVEMLASRPDLWFMVVLYSSLLPEKHILETLPRHLCKLESPKEREVVVGHLKEFLNNQDLELQVLRRVVEMILQESEMQTGPETDVSALDARKMKAILWLTVDEFHAGEALLWSNQLLRQFLSANKTLCALEFVRNVLNPSGIVDLLTNSDVLVPCSGSLAFARSEVVAWNLYLEAMSLMDKWTIIVGEEAAIVNANAAASGTSGHLQTDASIALHVDRHNVIQKHRESMARVVDAANEVSRALVDVLTTPGGWLFVEEGEEGVFENSEELGKLRSSLLPQVVSYIQDICAQTAEYLSGALDDAALALAMKRQEALQELDEASDGVEVSPMSPVYWTRRSIDVVQFVVSDTHKVMQAFGSAESKKFLERVSESTADEMIYQV